MNAALPVLAALAIATPAVAQNHTRTEAAPLEQIMASAGSAAVLQAFETAPDGIRHTASGFTCPSRSPGLALTAIGAGPLPGLASQDAVWCEYSDQAGAVARLSIGRDAPGAPVLTQDFCRGLPKALKLKMGPGIIPGVGKTTAPAQQKTLPTLTVGGAATPLWRCSTIREPYYVPTIVADSSGLRAANGWTVRAIHTPAPPPCCNSYREVMSASFFMQPVILVAQAVGLGPGVLPPPPQLEGLKPGAA